MDGASIIPKQGQTQRWCYTTHSCVFKTFDFKAQAAGLRSYNRTPPDCFENNFVCFQMTSPSLATQPEDVPFARTGGWSEYYFIICFLTFFGHQMSTLSILRISTLT